MGDCTGGFCGTRLGMVYITSTHSMENPLKGTSQMQRGLGNVVLIWGVPSWQQNHVEDLSRVNLWLTAGWAYYKSIQFTFFIQPNTPILRSKKVKERLKWYLKEFFFTPFLAILQCNQYQWLCCVMKLEWTNIYAFAQLWGSRGIYTHTHTEKERVRTPTRVFERMSQNIQHSKQNRSAGKLIIILTKCWVNLKL